MIVGKYFYGKCLEERVFSSALCFRMNINNSRIGKTASEPSISNDEGEASISQLISPVVVTTSPLPMDLDMPHSTRSQPLLISDQSGAEIQLRQRTAWRRRRQRRAQRRWKQRVQHQQLAHQIRYWQMATQHFQQQQDHRYNQDEEREQEQQQDRDRYNRALPRSVTFSDLLAEVMDERLLEMYDWETLSPEHQLGQRQLYGLESTLALEQPTLVQEETEQSPRIHAFGTSEGDEPQKKQMTEDCDPTPLNNIQNTSTLHLFDSTIFQIEQTSQIDEPNPSPDTSEQHETAMKHSSNNKNNTDTWRIYSQTESSRRLTLLNGRFIIYFIE